MRSVISAVLMEVSSGFHLHLIGYHTIVYFREKRRNKFNLDKTILPQLFMSLEIKCFKSHKLTL